MLEQIYYKTAQQKIRFSNRKYDIVDGYHICRVDFGDDERHNDFIIVGNKNNLDKVHGIFVIYKVTGRDEKSILNAL